MSPIVPASAAHTNRSAPIEEQGVTGLVSQQSISQGMWRAIAISVLVNYALRDGAPSCLVVDDVGEGLDFGRACGVIKVLRKHAAENELQVVCSTNSRFVMNSVPLEEWTILQRTGGLVKGRNVRSDPALFEEYKFMGLNNFDLLASGFLEDFDAGLLAADSTSTSSNDE